MLCQSLFGVEAGGWTCAVLRNAGCLIHGVPANAGVDPTCASGADGIHADIVLKLKSMVSGNAGEGAFSRSAYLYLHGDDLGILTAPSFDESIAGQQALRKGLKTNKTHSLQSIIDSFTIAKNHHAQIFL